MTTFIRFVVVIILIVVVVLGWMFSNNNATEVPLWLGWQFSAQRVGVWIILSFSMGGIAGVLLGFGLFKRIKHKVQINKLRSQLKKVEKQLSDLRDENKKRDL